MVDWDTPGATAYDEAKAIIETAGGTVHDPAPPQTAGSKLAAMMRGYGCTFPRDPPDPVDLCDRVLAKLNLVEQMEPTVTVGQFEDELARVNELVHSYQHAGHTPGALLLLSTIDRGNDALESTSTDRINAAYAELQGCE